MKRLVILFIALSVFMLPAAAFAEETPASEGGASKDAYFEEDVYAQENAELAMLPPRCAVYTASTNWISLKVTEITKKPAGYRLPEYIYVRCADNADFKNARTSIFKYYTQYPTIKNLKPGTTYYFKVGSYYMKDGARVYSDTTIDFAGTTCVSSFFGGYDMKYALSKLKTEAPDSTGKLAIKFPYRVIMSQYNADSQLMKTEALYQQYFQRTSSPVWSRTSVSGEYCYISLSFKIARSYSAAKTRGAKADAKINSIVAGAKKQKNQTAKIRYVDEQICKTCSYDSTKKRAERNNPYGCLIEKKAVCKGYAETFFACMYKLGIPCEFVFNKTHTHVWCKVKLNGKWLHIDTTWNDAGSKSSRKYFLMEGSKINKVKSHNWL